jgi:predicted nucleotidyltransferase
MDRTAIIQRITEFLAGREEVLFAYLLVSFAEGCRFNDIDVAVYLDRDEDFEYEADLSVEMQSILRFPIDVKVLNSAPLAFRHNASKGRLILSRDDGIRWNFLERTWDDYLDFKPIAIRHLKEVLLG